MPTAYSDKPFVERKIQAFFQNDQVLPFLKQLQSLLPDHSDLLITGGAVRNIIIQQTHGWSPRTLDIDIFIRCPDKDLDLGQILENQEIRQTDLGGIRWMPASSLYSFDLCLLKNFIIIQKYNLPPTRETLLAVVDFTANAAIFDFEQQKLFEHNCIDAVKKQLLDFNTTRIYTKLLLAYRTLLIRYKTQFMLSKQIFQFIKTAIDIDLLVSLKNLFLSKQSRETVDFLLDDYNQICGCKDYKTYISKNFSKIK